jgi:hypothetical protein
MKKMENEFALKCSEIELKSQDKMKQEARKHGEAMDELTKTLKTGSQIEREREGGGGSMDV